MTGRFCIMATGCLSAPLLPEFPSMDRFDGISALTSLWPLGGIDLAGKRVALIGTYDIRTMRKHYTFDVIVYATGFDAITGALARIEVTGWNGVGLSEKWTDGPVNYLGLMVSDMPNLLTVTGPGSPGSLTNVVVAIEHHVEWNADCLEHMRANGFATIEPCETAEHVDEIAQGTMYTAPGCRSWYLGAHVPGRTSRILPYTAGLDVYARKCEAITASG